ncbi:hypothetical protein CSP5_0621 [Cuniculiplasma divulgatum]|uniref:ArsR family transcriptional regulator n=1 Tax=Cuniculiplasma divulgatum TaxID=1673428 RepID=A0A1N5TMA5_9ARCH|nr:hypothetical protein CSP5_0621 [Cuniculiplasma divulgatum]
MNVTELKIKVNASFDSTDLLILDIFRRIPSRSLRVHTIVDILEYEEVMLNSWELRDRLRRLVILGLVVRHQGKRSDRYSISHEYMDP